MLKLFKFTKITWIYVDEFSTLFANERSGDFFAKVYKRIRKHGGVATGITQNITEILDNKQASVMLANSEFVVLLQQKKKDLQKLIDLYDLSPTQSSYLTTGEKGTGLIICGRKVIPFAKILPKTNALYTICSTNFSELQSEILKESESAGKNESIG